VPCTRFITLSKFLGDGFPPIPLGGGSGDRTANWFNTELRQRWKTASVSPVVDGRLE